MMPAMLAAGFQWGTAGEWVAAGATLIAVVFAWVQIRREHSETREALELNRRSIIALEGQLEIERARRAEELARFEADERSEARYVDITCRYLPGHDKARVVFFNRGSASITDVRLVMIAAHAVTGVADISIVAPGADGSAMLSVGEPRQTTAGLVPVILFTDSFGRRWRRWGHTDVLERHGPGDDFGTLLNVLGGVTET